ncbi:MAG TPA: peptidyl-alpha-hydroxyglycine alpha-amidating lyase family protein [Mucilaginibacter sp.]|nr:peptidyl-alpha-hydroxyglycine alpha-amidating lyase family protein [Mucilaginibacter sp.]
MLLAFTLPAIAQTNINEKGSLDITGPYRVVENWFKPGIEQWNQPITGVAIDNPSRVFVVSTGQQLTEPGSLIIGPDGATLNVVKHFTPVPVPIAHPTHEHLILVLNADGKVVEDWSQWNNELMLPHSVIINPHDPERHVWVVDREGDQILEFTNDGKKLVLRIGEKGIAGTDHNHFNWPSSMLFMPDGAFYVTDGYNNTRVVKFDKNGKYLMEWGTKGDKPGQFNLVHDIAVDSQHRIYVADRGNNRVQIFSETGKFIDQWPNILNPSHFLMMRDGTLWLISGAGNRIAKFDLSGKLITYWGTFGREAGNFNDPHTIDVDSAGNLYIVEVFNNRLEKFVPREGADKSRLVGEKFILTK